MAVMAAGRSRGDGSVYPRAEKRKRRDGSTVEVVRYVAAVRDPAAPSGVRVRYTAAMVDPSPAELRSAEKEALRLLSGIRREVAQGVPRSDRKTVGDLLDDWLDDAVRRVRPSTATNYRQAVRVNLAPVRRIRATSFSPADIRRLLAKLSDDGFASSTVALTYRILRIALRSAVIDGQITKSPADGVKTPKVKHAELAILTPQQARDVIGSKDARVALWTLLLGTGIRIGEALALRWSDLDLEVGTVAVSGTLRTTSKAERASGLGWKTRDVPKTEAGFRTIALPSFVSTKLRALPRSSVFVFPGPTGGPALYETVREDWARFRDARGLPPLRLHDLRHTAASLMLAGGLSLDDVMRVLGHSSIAVTVNTYGHMVEGRSREIARRMEEVIG